VLAAALAGSVALLGFGIDSFVETASGRILIWRLRTEGRHARSPAEIETLDRHAHKLVALRDHPSTSFIGIGVTTISIGVMCWLARAQRRAAAALKSRAL
jgi:divalent metal cation (Fe/Co/Zn/Cd) transporter